MNCESCANPVELPAEFLAILAKVQPKIGELRIPIPTPRLCWRCRYQRRLLHRNEWSLYRRTCDASGKSMVSIYSPDKAFKVYSQSAWWSDGWDARSFGREFDFTEPFFAQFVELQREVPRLSIVNTNSENSDFTNQSCWNKNCYLCASCSYNEDCLYGYWVQNSKRCLDSYLLEKCETCYECCNGINLYECAYVYDSENCHHTWFSSDCQGCAYLYGCQGLRNVSYRIHNEEVSAERWREFMATLRLSPQVVADELASLREMQLVVPQKYYRGRSIENSSGDLIRNCKNTTSSFNCRDCQDVCFSQDAWRMKDSSDITEVLDTECCYEIEGAISSFSAWCTKSWPIHECYYCDLCFNSKNLFGCIGLRNSQYCILNKQYSQSEYEQLVLRICAHMQSSGEWGEHFPESVSPFAYNETVAQDYFPLSKQEVQQRGWRWHEEQLPTSALESSRRLDDVSELETLSDQDILGAVLTCVASGKPYRLVAPELKFYRELRLPLPRLCPAERRRKRMELRNPRQLWARRCQRCDCSFESSYAPERREKVVCEECYLKEIY